ncbi:hypothetical protein ACO2Q0_02860 [Phenylobacterium sp. VNQ135]|uniref:hypothetical protein n=1 Tax=Phenylobacterium sp. VNQ135 TaxID=3400922 RepID=UPI003BFE59AB
MTEDEAKTKACCGPRNNGANGADDDILCIGSACMAWREWRDVATSAKTGISRAVVLGGYCGLAGAPQ